MKYHGLLVGQVGTGWTGTGSIVGVEPVPRHGQASSVGVKPVPGTGTASSDYLEHRFGAQVSFDLSLSQWERFDTGSVPVPCVCTKPVPLVHSLCLYQPCPTWIDTLSVQPFQSRHLTKSRVFPYQKTRTI